MVLGFVEVHVGFHATSPAFAPLPRVACFFVEPNRQLCILTFSNLQDGPLNKERS